MNVHQMDIWASFKEPINPILNKFFVTFRVSYSKGVMIFERKDKDPGCFTIFNNQIRYHWDLTSQQIRDGLSAGLNYILDGRYYNIDFTVSSLDIQMVQILEMEFIEW